MEYIVWYIGLCIVLYVAIFYKVVFPIVNTVCVVLLNDAELRGGGGLITLVAEIRTFFGIPYGIRMHSHSEINQYSESSFYPFNDHLAKDLFFRDTNYSLFRDENFQRMEYFYKNNFPNNPVPKTWISIPYSFIEAIFIFPFWLKFWEHVLRKSNLFRSFSHITGDNSLDPDKRKFVLMRFISHWVFLCMVPGVLPYIFARFLQFYSRRDVSIAHTGECLKKPEVYIGLVENNLRWRKSNRYMRSEQEYIFHVQSLENGAISGTGELIIRKILPSAEHFPFVGNYSATFSLEKSEHFRVLSGVEWYHQCNPSSTFEHTITFSFCLPMKGGVDIIRQSGVANTHIITHFITPPYIALPQTNLWVQADHWHHSVACFVKDFRLQYAVIPDPSPLRMLFRGVVGPRHIQISFQKPILLKKENYRVFYEGRVFEIDSIESNDRSDIIVIGLKEDIPVYSEKERTHTMKVLLSDIEDITGMRHYNKHSRELWVPWAEAYV